ncbi:MAG: hypothetical protein KGL39_45845 [Patescibacteria group bacterium]|nr:hypothetical protein [Patescibacteria group bacterium]
MSCRMVDDDCLKAIAGFVRSECLSTSAWALRVPEAVKALWYGATPFIDCLYDMNRAAYASRYGNVIADKDVPRRTFTRRGWDCKTDVQTYRALDDYLYQCGEPPVDGCALYKGLSDLQDSLARRIISTLPDDYGKPQY